MNKIKQKEGLPFVKLMMLLSSMAPLFFLIGIRGIQIEDHDKIVVTQTTTWLVLGALLIIPFVILQLRIRASRKAGDVWLLDTRDATMNKEYLFTYLFTVLLPLYSVSISTFNELIAVACAVFFVIFVLWNMNMHFINILFAFAGYRVFTLPNQNSAVLLTTRQNISANLKTIKAHRISNSVFIELRNYSYDNK